MGENCNFMKARFITDAFNARTPVKTQEYLKSKRKQKALFISTDMKRPEILKCLSPYMKTSISMPNKNIVFNKQLKISN